NNEQHHVIRIYQHQMDDIKYNHITVIADEKLDSHSIIYYTSVNFIKSHGTLWDRFASKFGDNDGSGRVKDHLNLSEADQAKYDNALAEGGILLFVNGLTHTEEVEEVEAPHDEAAD